MSRAPGPVRLASAGVGVVGVCYGMARYGYGLLLPDIRRDYGLGPGVLGAIATGGYVSYLLAVGVAGATATRLGARRTAATAGVLAAVGMTMAGLSRSPEVLGAGIIVGGAGAGFAFAPFSDAARMIAAPLRARVLAAISCGTGYGVALAAPIALVAGASWRGAWLAFAAVALAATAWAVRVLPPARREERDVAPPYGWGSVVCARSAPLLAASVLIGLGSSAYWTFAVEHLTDGGALAPAAGRIFLGVVGVASVVATLAGDLVHRLGGRWAYLVTVLAEAVALALLALVPSSFGLALVSGILFGAGYNAAVGIAAIWATEVFSERPSLGVSAVLGSNGAGLLLGPLGAGLLAGPLGLGGVLLLGAGLVAAAGLFAPREAILPAAALSS